MTDEPTRRMVTMRLMCDWCRKPVAEVTETTVKWKPGGEVRRHGSTLTFRCLRSSCRSRKGNPRSWVVTVERLSRLWAENAAIETRQVCPLYLDF